MGIEGTWKSKVRPELGAIAALAVVLLFVTSCGSRQTEATSGSAQSQPDSKAQTDTKAPAATAAHEPHAAEIVPKREPTESSPTTRVVLSSKGCVDFEPHWMSVQPGQSLTWRSELKSSVTIHVSPGAFDKGEYVVRAGATVKTGPARTAGTYTIWTEPAACQSAPHGVQGSGPGVTVAASTPH